MALINVVGIRNKRELEGRMYIHRHTRIIYVREANHGVGFSQGTNSDRNVNGQKHQKQKILLNTLPKDGPLIKYP
jgi:hypothetical protein